MKKHLSKNARDFIILLIATPIMMFFVGLDLAIALPMLVVYVMQWWLEDRYPKYKEAIKTSGILVIMLFIFIYRSWWIVWVKNSSLKST